MKTKGLTRFDAYLLFCIAAGSNVLLPYLAAFLGGTVTAAVYYAGLVVLICLLFGRRDGFIDGMRLEAPRLSVLLPTVAAAFIGVLLSSCVTYLWTTLLAALGYTAKDAALSTPENITQLVSMLALSAMIPGFSEEFLFRGAILSGMETRLSEKKSILLCAVLFALLHGSVEGLPTELIVGTALGFLAVSTGSLYTAVIYHTMHNAFVLILTYFMRNEEAAAATFSPASDIGVTLFYGLLYFLLLRTLCRGFRENGVLKSRMTPREIVVCAAAFLLGAGFLISGFFF